MPLPQARREQLDGIVMKMYEQNANEQEVQTVVNDFVNKFQNEIVPEPPKKDFLQTAADISGAIFPGKKVGEAIGTLGGYGVTFAKEKMGLAPKGATAAYDLSAPSPLQVTGDVAAGALTVAGAKGVGTGGKFLSQVGKSTLFGAGIGGAQGLAETGNLKGTLEGANAGAEVGAVLPVVGKGLGFAGKQLKMLPERLIRSATGQSKKAILAGQDVSKYMLENRKFGTAQKLLTDSETIIDDLSNKINQNLSKVKDTVRPNDVFEMVSQLPEAEGALMTVDDIKDVVTKLAPQTKKLLQSESLNLTDANKLRQLIDKTIGDRGFLASQDTTNKAILKSFSNTLRETIKQRAPEGTRGFFSDLANEIRLRNSLAEKVAKKSGNQIIGFGDLIGGGLGGVFGGGVAGAAGGVAARRALQSTPVLTGGAVVTNEAIKFLEPLIKQLTPAARTEILNLVGRNASQSSSSAE